ncbi:HCLS1-associated protein X-1-like [Argopecten irradians]|uniref:HCLS1-associated protein X-1-like n=1 Tax=Argopecten irradians TaxID=31199 RepID=UPI00371717E1
MSDIHDLFRAMFRLGGNRPPDGHHIPKDGTFIIFDSEDSENEVPWGQGSGHTFGGNIFAQFQQDMEQMHREMAEMFQGFDMGSASDHPRSPQLPANPRDDMLKKPDSVPEQSSQLDPSQPGVRPRMTGQLGFPQPPSFFRGIFSPSRPGLPGLPGPGENTDNELKPNLPAASGHSTMPNTNTFFSGRSVSVSTSIGPNGHVEERRTVRDSQGGEEVTITRKQGNQTHSVTTKTDTNGVQEKIENFTNMNESDLSDFNSKWGRKEEQIDYSAPSQPDSLLKSQPQFSDDNKDTVLTSRLKRFFDWLKPKVE